MAATSSQSETTTVEYVEVSVPRVHNLHHVEIYTPKIEESLDFFTRVLGLHETHRERQSVFLRAQGEFGAYSTVLTESDKPGLAHTGWQVAEREHVDGWSRRLREAGIEHERIDGGSDFAQGDTVRFKTPAGNTMELFFDFERLASQAPSKLLNMPTRYPAPGIGVRRLDHLNMTAKDVDSTRDWYCDVLGFKLREAARSEEEGDLGIWLSVTSQIHDIAFMKDGLGFDGRLHHVGYYVDTPEGVLRAADIYREEELEIDAGPGKHGLTQAFFIYVFEPGGNRIELFSGGYAIHDPNWQPVIWEGEHIRRAIVWYGGELPQSFFDVAT